MASFNVSILFKTPPKILSDLKDDHVKLVIDKVPEMLMSQVSKDFTYKLILCNKANLLAVNSDL